MSVTADSAPNCASCGNSMSNHRMVGHEFRYPDLRELADWRIPMGAANLIFRDCTKAEALERAEKWRWSMQFDGELLPVLDHTRAAAATTRDSR